VVRLVMVAGILLGPEKTSPHRVWVLGGDSCCSSHRSTVVGAGGGCWVWGCVLFENYTVDASIFVVKLLRANGGCLGTRSR
jgi:hypothetical protein